MGHSGGHICQCLGRLWSLRRSSVVTVSEEGPGRTGGRFVEDVLGLARGLSEHGLRGGDVVAVAALNSYLYLEWLLAVTFNGGIVAPLNHRWSFDEARFAMEMVRPTMLVVDEHCSPWSRRVVREHGIQSLRAHVFMGDPSFEATDDNSNYIWMDSLRRPSQGLPEFDYRWAPEDIALICFTSGTTGRPKGVCISHTALIVQSLAKIAIVDYSEDDVYLHTAPLCHIGGISSCMAMLMAGGCHVFMPKFEAKSAINAIEKYSVTSLITVPTMVADMISFIGKDKEWKGGCFVKKVLNGGGGLSAELTNVAIQLFPNAKLLSAYGMTEACSSLTFLTLHDPIPDHRRFPSTINGQGGLYVGKPAPHIELRICIEDEINHPTRIGKIQTRGPHVLVGYWGCTSVSEKQSWFDTGDVGWLDDSGGLWLFGRDKDRIKTGGENVYPEEVEAALCQHPGVVSAVVIGLPDTRLSEAVVACVRIRENWRWMDSDSHWTKENERRTISGLVLRKHCRAKSLTGFKIPKIFILWLYPFPLTSTGKLRRDEVRREAMSYMNFLSSNL